MRRALARALASACGLLVALAPSVTAGQAVDAPPMDIAVAFDRPAATIGDRLTLTVTVHHSSDIVVTPVRPSIARSELVSDGTLSVNDPAGVVTTAVFVYQVFALGAVTSGPVTVRWLMEDGSTGAVEVGGATTQIVSVRAEGDVGLRPLKPQAIIAGAPPAWIQPAAIGVLALAVIAALAALVVWWRRRRHAEPEVRVSESAEAAARAQLDALRGLRLDDEASFQRYYGTISAAVRGYLGDRFGFNASALTTAELERRMTGHGVDRWQARLVGGLLDRCDAAVYARRYPEPVSADHDLTVAYEIVELSRPRPLEAVEEEAGVAS